MNLSVISLPDLPVRAHLNEICARLQETGKVVLIAPPGAGKTTLVPLALLNLTAAAKRIIVLEPRRLAARAAAERMAALLGETVGRRVGFRIKGESRISAETRIEVVTEGILTRMLQSDPELKAVGVIIFDEFHERSLNADLGLALALEVRSALRPDLRIVVMSATLDAAPIAELLGDAPVVHSDGRAFPVETRWLSRPREGHLDQDVAALILTAHDAEAGDILVFLPGAAEIRRVATHLGGLPRTTQLHALFGTMPFHEQRAALAACAPGQRKIILATAIAETSLTVEGVRIVVDAGLARRSRFDPGSGMAGLVTERASKAEATQRQGRAGRLSAGVCYRLWTRAEEGAMAEFAPAEIETTDLAGFALDCAAWGVKPGELALLTPPPEGAMAEANDLLQILGALDSGLKITAHGRAVAEIPLHPRLSHMVLSADPADRGEAVVLATLLEVGNTIQRDGSDITTSIRGLSMPKEEGRSEGALRRARADARQLGKRFKIKPDWQARHTGALIARAYPDRLAQRRTGRGANAEARFLLSGGKGAQLRAGDALANMSYLAVADLDVSGGARKSADALIRAAAPITKSEIAALFADQIAWRARCEWSPRHQRVMAEQRHMLGALVLDEKPWPDAPAVQRIAAMADGIRDLGLASLPWTKASERLVARAGWARRNGVNMPEVDRDSLLENLDEWLTPHLAGVERKSDLQRLDLVTILSTYIGWQRMQDVNAAAPEAFTAPTGTTCRIDYGGTAPAIEIRLQELFGMTVHPQVAGQPLVITLLSPAGRAVQKTADLPGFWRTSYADVRRDMRGRYPRHPWPENPADAAPTRRAKPRG